MATAYAIDGVDADHGLLVGGPLSLHAAQELILTLCESACAGDAPERILVTFSTDGASPGRGIDYDGAAFGEASCRALRAIRGQLGLRDADGAGEGGAEDRGLDICFEIAKIPSATIAAARLATFAARVADLRRATGCEPELRCA